MTFERHRLDIEPCLLGVEPGEVAERGRERAPPFDHRSSRVDAVVVGRTRLVVDRQVAEGVRLGIGVLEDAAPRGLDEEHLARSQPPAPNGLAWLEWHRTGLGCDSDEPVPGDREGRRPQPVAVDQRADAATVREDDRGGAIPRCQHPGGPAPERRDVRMRCPPEPDRLGDRGEQRGRQLPAGRRQEFQPLVEGQGVRSVGREQGPSVEQLGRERRPTTIARASPDLLAVAADRVDLAVVRDRPERLGEAPDGRRVGGIPLVEDRVPDVEILTQVGIQIREARPGDEALVDDRRARRGRDRHAGERAARGPDRRLDAATGDHEATLEGAVARACGACDDGLRDERSRRRRRRAQRAAIERDGSPADDRETGIGVDTFDEPAGRRSAGPAAWQERHHDPRAIRGSSGDEVQHGRRQRQRHAGAVARLAVGTECPAMREGGQSPERDRQDASTVASARVSDEPDAARVVLEPGVVQRSPRVASVGRVHRHGVSERRWSGRRPDGTGPHGGMTVRDPGRSRREEPFPTDRGPDIA